MREYHEVFGHELPPLPREPVLSDFYTPSDEQHYRELGFIALSMIGITTVLKIQPCSLHFAEQENCSGSRNLIQPNHMASMTK